MRRPAACLVPAIAIYLPLGSDWFMSHWLSHSAAAVRDMRYRDAEADIVLQLDDIFLFVGQCGALQQRQLPEHMDHFVR